MCIAYFRQMYLFFLIISDNSSVAMTGSQDSLAVGRLKNICLGIGVDTDHLKIMVPLKKNFSNNIDILRNEIEYKGVSVIISQKPCVRLSPSALTVINPPSKVIDDVPSSTNVLLVPLLSKVILSSAYIK